MTDYKVADMSLADFGRAEIQLAECEMPRSCACATSTVMSSLSREQSHGMHSYDDSDRRID